MNRKRRSIYWRDWTAIMEATSTD